MLYYGFSSFFFQAEDGIRDTSVTGVQTCALPIWLAADLGEESGKAVVIVHGPAVERMVVALGALNEIGRASCRERVEVSGVDVSAKKKNNDECGQRR